VAHPGEGVLEVLWILSTAADVRSLGQGLAVVGFVGGERELLQRPREGSRMVRRSRGGTLTQAGEDRLNVGKPRVGYDPVFGARPLKRAIQQLIETPLAKKIIAGEINDGDEVLVEPGAAGFAFEVRDQAKVLS
jgi:hypothetical protein